MYRMFRTFCRHTAILLALLAMPLLFSAAWADTQVEQMLENSVVKIYVTSKSYTSYSPWNADSISSSGSGFIIDGKRILTNAHVVADQVFVEIQRDGNPKRYQAEVQTVSHELDIAILKVKDERFFNKGKPLPLGELPDIHQEIMVYGYPIGGDTLSTTRGIVSRIEYLPYTHSGLSYQMIQIDATINPGNSGGPAIADGKVAGVVMQKAGGEGENIGYIIPAIMVKRFLQDMEDGKYDGFPELPLQAELLLSPALKKKYQLGEEQSGILINKVCANTSAEKLLQKGDVITHIDGKNIDDDGTSPLNSHKTIYFAHYLDLHQVGETLALDIVRDGKALKVELPLDKADESTYVFDQEPRYFIYGGFVFVADDTYDSCLSREDYDDSKEKDKQESVTISQVLAASSNLGFHDLSSMAINKLNGETFNTFEEFYKRLKTSTAPFIMLEDYSGYEVAIDRELAEQEHQEILKQYRIHRDHSAEIDGWDKELTKK
ncbi:MAG: trypsin-like peptidase domain-containing protein [Thiothrix sp.]